MTHRIEKDSLGELPVPVDALYGIHTQRALQNFRISGRPPHQMLIRAFGAVKKAAATVNHAIGRLGLSDVQYQALNDACDSMCRGELNQHVVVDALQGGAGTSTHMNVNEVLANHALAKLGRAPGEYEIISPLQHVNMHQSTNDTYPTALKLAGMWMLAELEQSVVGLQESFQAKEKEFSHIVKVGRTQYQDAVLTTVGRQFGAYADALGRDRWRLYKCQERLRTVNLGGTAVGTGLGAPKAYIFDVVDTLRQQTGVPLARAENLVECTQNADVYVEVSGMVCACAATLQKISSDVRFMSSGPDAGIGELILEPRQVGSSIMPAKVNPVILEAVTQVAMQVFGNDAVIKNACASGSLELNPFLPLIADNLLNSLELLSRATSMLSEKCISSIQANEEICAAHVEQSSAVATALVSQLGYETVATLVKKARNTQRSIQSLVVDEKLLTQEELDTLLSHWAVCKLGD
ncbi:MAG: aspartate ammonia-lyase [Deltaproteobacteria bacterium]|nr:aspartate ammonia-lyase [Deltaproteobacteria bacterium]MBN2670500.1 aspartate ammonia-lyase [Deltaproteobacteria bacterium]